jgi:hypothetical protein
VPPPPLARSDRWIASAVSSSERTINRFTRALRAAWDGVWLGILSDERLARLDRTLYSSDRRYLSEQHNTQGLLPFEREMVEQYFPRKGPVVVVGAGAGREVLALRELGFDAHGYDCNPELVARGNELLVAAGHEPVLQHVGRDTWPDHGPVVGAILGWGAYTHIAPRARRVDLLRSAHQRLASGTPLLISFLARRGAGLRYEVVPRVANPLRRLRGARPLMLGDVFLAPFAHVFTTEEATAELTEAGFEVHHCSHAGYGHAVASA